MPDAITASPEASALIHTRAAELLNKQQYDIWSRTDRIFVWLLAAQWIGGIFLAFWLTPFTWAGDHRQVHPHVWQALFLGAGLIVSPLLLSRLRPGAPITRHVIAVSQSLSSALLIHLGGGRIEMHFHVFGSLAFVAFYRDWRVLISASAVVAVDHLLRGIFAPESVFGLLAAGNWRWVEHAFWVIFEDIFLIASCRWGVRELTQIAERQALLEFSYRTVEEKVRERTRQLEALQQDVIKSARSAGMAEIATSVLHNVGNVLNSVNVSVNVATSKVRQSPLANLTRVVGMLDQHKDDLGTFLTSDDRGKQIPGYLRMVSELLSAENSALLEEMNSLGKNVEHIKQIVSLQQSNAKGAGLINRFNPHAIIEDAIRVAMGAVITRGGITIKREFSPLPDIHSDQHILLQILINLITNAKQALQLCEVADRCLTIRSSALTRNQRVAVRIEVIDNGAGIALENLGRIFNHGFTTRKEGHGFGLHSAANSARQLDGTLTVRSDGLGTGAAFVLEITDLNEVAVP